LIIFSIYGKFYGKLEQTEDDFNEILFHRLLSEKIFKIIYFNVDLNPQS
jgi:hypothetical protein